MNIRNATENDLESWISILHDSYIDIYSSYVSADYIQKNYNLETLKNNFIADLNSSNELFIIEVDNKIIGLLKIGKPILKYSDGHNYYREDIMGIGEIKSLHIMKEYRHKGYGSALIKYAESRLSELNYNMASLWVKVNNESAISFYLKNGYIETKYLNPHTNDKAISMVMEKKLNNY